jgi:Protein of unknown function (DUF3592)
MSGEPRFPPPPRTVPASLAIANLFNGLAQLGWALFGFGMLFFWLFAMSADVSFITFRGPLAETEGEVVRVERTGASEGKRPIYANHYTYFVGGQPTTGVSYSLGHRADPGQRVTVEYASEHPTRSRIAGMRRNTFGPGALFVALFPLAGLTLLIVATAIGWKRIRLLRTGYLAVGTLKDKQPTSATVNKRVVYELTFEFAGRDGRRHELKKRTSLPERLEDEAQEPLLFDPDRPSRAYLLDEAPSRPKLGTRGELLGAPRPLLRLILPAIVVAANGGTLLRLLT